MSENPILTTTWSHTSEVMRIDSRNTIRQKIREIVTFIASEEDEIQLDGITTMRTILLTDNNDILGRFAKYRLKTSTKRTKLVLFFFIIISFLRIDKFY